jgi:hypothetical protein
MMWMMMRILTPAGPSSRAFGTVFSRNGIAAADLNRLLPLKKLMNGMSQINNKKDAFSRQSAPHPEVVGFWRVLFAVLSRK